MNRKKIAVVLALVVFALTLNGCKSSAESTSDNITVGENQRLAYAVVTAIEGNEMTYMEVEESQLNLSTDEDSDTAGDAQTDKNQTDKSQTDDNQTESTEGAGQGAGSGGGTPPSGGTPPDMNSSTGTDGSDSGGTPPAMGGSTSTDSDTAGGTPPDMGSAPDMSGTEAMMPMEEGSTESMGGGFDKSNMVGTSATVQIPVGVAVHTTSGTDTTFSRIVSGDILKLLFETNADGDEVIVEIWMVQ